MEAVIGSKMPENIINKIRNYFEAEKQSGVREYLFAPKKKDEFLTFKEEVMSCQMCGLAKTRKNVVFGSGNIRARLVFVGEAPGFDEDIQGLPFVGKAGILLTRIIEAMGLKREDVYICNILKCRPPQNRNPLPDEIASCAGHLSRQIDHIKPQVICGLGKFASQVLLKTETPITKLRGNWQEYRGIRFMPTYHPAYLLRNPQDKKLAWQDMKKIMFEVKPRTC